MANFPALKTGAVAQYPSDRQQNFSTQVFRFLDGSEQRFPAYGSSLRQWVIRLDLLDESELTALQDFFVTEGGRAGVFSFTDPFDSTVYTSCSFGADELDLSFGGPQDGQATVMIRQVGSGA
jgi:phage-related protein